MNRNFDPVSFMSLDDFYFRVIKPAKDAVQANPERFAFGPTKSRAEIPEFEKSLIELAERVVCK